MKAMTLQDDASKNPVPWLTMVEYKIKTIETRMNWMRRQHRGNTLLTASATSRTPNAGLAVCVVNVIDIVPMTEVHVEAACIGVADNRWALILDDLRWLSRKFPVKGALGVFDVQLPADVTFYKPDPHLLTPREYPEYFKKFIREHFK